MTATTTEHRTGHARIKSIRTTAGRRGLTIMTRSGALWIVRDGEIVAGGRRGLTIEQVEHMIRAEGFGRELATAS